jgi:hypothetical protein
MKLNDHGKSNHHCRFEPPAGHTPRLPCLPITISATSWLTMPGSEIMPCQLHQPVGSARRAPSTSRTIECRPSAPISTSPCAEVPSSNATRTPLCVLTTPVARALHLMRSAGKPSSSRSSRTRRGTIRTGAPSLFAIVVTSKAARGRPVDVTTRTVDSCWPAPSISTPSCCRTVAPLDQIVTAPPPACTSDRWSKTVTSCPSRNNPRATEMPLTPAPTTRIRGDRLDGAFGAGGHVAEHPSRLVSSVRSVWTQCLKQRPGSVLRVPLIVPPLKSRLQLQQAQPGERRARR